MSAGTHEVDGYVSARTETRRARRTVQEPEAQTMFPSKEWFDGAALVLFLFSVLFVFVCVIVASR